MHNVDLFYFAEIRGGIVAVEGFVFKKTGHGDMNRNFHRTICWHVRLHFRLRHIVFEVNSFVLNKVDVVFDIL